VISWLHATLPITPLLDASAPRAIPNLASDSLRHRPAHVESPRFSAAVHSRTSPCAPELGAISGRPDTELDVISLHHEQARFSAPKQHTLWQLDSRRRNTTAQLTSVLADITNRCAPDHTHYTTLLAGRPSRNRPRPYSPLLGGVPFRCIARRHSASLHGDSSHYGSRIHHNAAQAGSPRPALNSLRHSAAVRITSAHDAPRRHHLTSQNASRLHCTSDLSDSPRQASAGHTKSVLGATTMHAIPTLAVNPALLIGGRQSSASQLDPLHFVPGLASKPRRTSPRRDSTSCQPIAHHRVPRVHLTPKHISALLNANAFHYPTKRPTFSPPAHIKTPHSSTRSQSASNQRDSHLGDDPAQDTPLLTARRPGSVAGSLPAGLCPTSWPATDHRCAPMRDCA